MSKIIRPQDTHLFDGVDFLAKVHLILRLILEGFAALIAVSVGIGLLWWARRLHFLNQSDAILMLYHVDDPKKQRLHAGLAGFCLVLTLTSIVVCWLTKTPAWAVSLTLATIGYVFLTVIFFQNRSEDPIANAWD